MFSLLPQSPDEDRCLRFRIAAQGAVLDREQVLTLWEHDRDFRKWWIDALAGHSAPACRWETPVLDQARLRSTFEFALLEAPGLDRAPDRSPFDEHFRDAPEASVLRFANLGHDALLVVPTPGPASAESAHLLRFLRAAPEEQAHALWIEVARAVRERLTQPTPFWLNTAGGGVAWLHLRLDDRPKYYHHARYRDPAHP